MHSSGDNRLNKIRAAYDLTMAQADQGIDPMAELPAEIRSSEGYRYLSANRNSLNSNAPDVREFLAPAAGMRFLDAGCCANLFNYRLDRWPSAYYGIDISPRLIDAMKNFVSREQIPVGGLYTAEITRMPFEDNFFDIAAVIGVLEYYPIDYIKEALKELHRVLKPESRVVLDIPNPDHPYVNVMAGIEEYLRRLDIINSRTDFATFLGSLFVTERIDDSQVMIKYFVKTAK